MFPFPKRGLYAITPEHLEGQPLTDAVTAALRGGAVAVQYRNKSDNKAQRQADAHALVRICDSFQVPLIVNDDVLLTVEVGAHGVHIGRDDGSLADARAAVGPDVLIGVSCYDQLGLALEAHAGGADYIAFGSFFASSTKPGAVRAPTSLVSDVRKTVSSPIVGIGGITTQNAGELLDAGVDVLSVVSAVFDAPDIEVAAREFASLF